MFENNTHEFPQSERSLLEKSKNELRPQGASEIVRRHLEAILSPDLENMAERDHFEFFLDETSTITHDGGGGNVIIKIRPNKELEMSLLELPGQTDNLEEVVIEEMFSPESNLHDSHPDMESIKEAYIEARTKLQSRLGKILSELYIAGTLSLSSPANNMETRRAAA